MTLLAVLAASCGDDAPARSGGGGSGGTDAGITGDAADGQLGGGGSGGVDARPDADGSVDAGDMGGGEVAQPCYSVTFVAPTNAAMLTADDDKDSDRCANGFQFDVRISSNAPDTTAVNLFGGSSLIGAGQVMNGSATFMVQLASGDTQLSIQFPTREMCTAASTKALVNVDCNVPTCTIIKPIVSATHPALNGVQAPAGDRVSAPGTTYQAAFEVTTDIDDGQPVSVFLNGATTPASTVNATAGKASFSGVTLTPDGTFQVEATCTARNAVVGRSMSAIYPVDTTSPDLAVSKPGSGDFIGPAMLTSNKFQICGSTTSADAIGLPAGLGSAANNFCAHVGASASVCAPIVASGTDACVSLDCTGSAPFDIVVELRDAAGNPTDRTLTGVTCSSANPSVQIISPASNQTLLAASAAQAFRDQNAAVAGAQTDVTACANRGGSAVLRVGEDQDPPPLTQIAGPVTAVAATGADNCPAGFGFVVRFPGVTLPESIEDANGAVVRATQLIVELTDSSGATGSSLSVLIWVDSIAPVVSLMSPLDLCGSFHQAAMAFTTNVTINSDTSLVTLSVTGASSTSTFSNPTYSGTVATFTAVPFAQGQSTVGVVATDPAGNATAMLPIPCAVTVGEAPVVVFTAPTSSQQLCAVGGSAGNCVFDSNSGAAGWQGSLLVHATVGSAALTTGNISFFAGGMSLGQAALDPSGNAQITNVTFFDGIVTVTASTDNIADHGVGTGTLTIPVDTGPPAAPTGLTASVLDRRQTSFLLSWTAPSDNGGSIAGYAVRAARVPITTGNFDDATVTKVVTFTGVPATPGQPDSVAATGLNIETGYYFAVAAVDETANRGPIAATGVAVQAQFLTTVLSGSGTDGIGVDLTGLGDYGTASDRSFTADQFSDLIVGGTGGRNVYLFFGSATGYSATPTVTITGTIPNFGQAVVNAGDLDGDGLDDIGIASPTDGVGKVFVFSRKNPPASWGSTTNWPATLTDSQANYVLTVDPPFSGGAGTIPTRGLTRLGNFDGTGSEDLAIGMGLHAARFGAVVIVKGSSSFGSMTIPDPANVATIEIDGTIANGTLGVGVIGIGQFYSSPAGPTLVASAPFGGAVYAFRGQAPVAAITTAAADDSVIGVAADRYGANLGFLGPLGASAGGLTIGAPAARYVDVHLGTTATGPFLGVAGGAPAASVRFVDTQSGTSFGVLNLGGGVKGSSQQVSFIGSEVSPVSDLVLAGQVETNTPIYIVNGSSIGSFSGTVDVSVALPGPVPGIIKVPGRIPTPWSGYAGAGVIIDSNKDGYSDFAIGEFSFNKPGRVVVFY